MDILKLISILLVLIVKVKKIICMDMYKENHIIKKRDILSDNFSSWIMPIKYQINDKDLINENVIKEAIKEIENNTCIRFNETNLSANNTQGIVFKLGKHCSSGVGRTFKNNTQVIQLTRDCSNKKGAVLHELGHALGLVHEHCRTDRDSYVIVHKENILREEKVNFEISNHSAYKNFSISYDYSSIMHYEQFDFTNGLLFWWWYPVLESRLHPAYNRMMGQRLKMTFNDYKKLNLAYCKCNQTEKKETKKKEVTKKKEKKKKGPENGIRCRNGGYIASSNSSKCICPFGYTGNFCNETIKSDKNCNGTTFNVTTKDIKTHWIAGSYKCFFSFVTEKRKKIQLGIYQSYAPYSKICTEDISHQIKYLKDKGTTGILLCSWRSDVINVTSEDNSALIYFNGNSNNAFMQFGFKQVD